MPTTTSLPSGLAALGPLQTPPLFLNEDPTIAKRDPCHRARSMPTARDLQCMLSKTGLESSLVYEYGFAFTHNKLEDEDIFYFNHEFLQSTRISIAKHRLEILKIARKAKGMNSAGTIRRTKRCLTEYIGTWRNHRNVGTFDKNDPTIGTGLVGVPACGNVMKLQIKVDDSTGKIDDACFKTFGCGSAIASSSVATEWVKGKQMEEVLTIKNTEIAKHLLFPPVKLHYSMLAKDAIKAAVKDYQAKQTKKKTGSIEASPAEKAVNA
ncbi:iron-sulfur cluster assembly protein 1-like [Malus sylvestris]|uniref:iron-sulfur cluster assembly protein 1-like n=1 Tax=Malus sylvestris TaxID=3752 RepID=UPI0021ABFDC2|nr:iron-sulfur cluster assembly protein 1-like [Malus sylvestris]